ncbi:signal transduction histidine kinase [Paenibacillus endophyticus]|uniref:histidine kinase n=1 Tax=Paenibacillus endophyticus TaxID=1294268 RepID=A0A7W5C6V7_9BACL|nr:sensor histidine kinase [Paenibacillus endophyticus]MBB3152281.1 signal transduction histidine kinase [Paenibacillus endophyticus]
MNILLNRIRTLLVAVPSVLSVANVAPSHYAIYTACVLFALLLIRSGSLFPKFRNLSLLAELICFSWLAHSYGGVLFLLLFSTLIASCRNRPERATSIIWSIAGLVALLSAMQDSQQALLLSASLLWLTTAAILYAANEYENKQLQIEDLYEALSASHAELDAARRRMHDYALQVEQQAQIEERNRIAKDIHDDLGHRLIRVKMMSEAALHLFDADADRARLTVEQIRDQLQDSMELMRRTVRRIASDQESDVRRYALDRLVEESAAAMGIAVSFRITGHARPIYPSMELILFKNAQEAITNAVRHGRATSITVNLAFDAAHVALTIANDGIIPSEPIEAGLGLKGMKERIALVGGQIEWERGARFSITTTLPLLGG